MGRFVSLEDASVTADLKVCCGDLALKVNDDIITVKTDKLRTKSTINGGPSYFEKYTSKLSKDGKLLEKCEDCGSTFTDKSLVLTIVYKEK